MSAPQRFLANDRNLVRTVATLTPSAVQAVANAVIETPLARAGTAQLKLTGSYTGLEDATYDFAIEDLTSTTKLISAPVYSGAGSETLTDIVATTVTAQDFKVECHLAGQPAVPAAVEIEGVSIVARAAGVAGNTIHINVDVSGLTFTPSSFSLIEDVKKGDGADAAPLKGPQYDWDTAAVGADGLIPSGAHRIAFEGDESNVYVQYKRFVDNAWQYFTVPALQNDYPAGTRVLTVSGTYTVSIIDAASSPPATDTLTGIVTVYDFLNAVKTTSTLADVDGVIANDRSPTGQAARDLALRTQARALLSTGDGSKAATGFTSVTVEPAANTELVTAECIAIDSRLDPNAFVGHEAWSLKGSVSGALGTIYTGEAFVGATFGLTIPRKLPPTNGNNAGRFSLTSFTRGSADAAEVEVCFAGKLGPNAVDQTITLTLTARPTSCKCDDLPVPELDTRCLGGAGSDTAMGYSAGAQTRIDDLYDWVSDLANTVTRYIAGKAFDGVPETTHAPDADGFSAAISTTDQAGATRSMTSATSAGIVSAIPLDDDLKTTGYADVALPGSFTALIDQFDSTLQLIDATVDPALSAGFAAWDDVVTAIKADLASSPLTALGNRLASVASLKYQLMLRRSLAAAGISPVGKSSASSQTSGDGCWQDFGDALFWKVVGADGEYAPIFTNHAFWSSRKHDDGAYYTTKEFAGIINVKCAQNLVVGDTITLTIGNTAALGTYQVGDVLKLPLIAAADQFLGGGIDANKIQKWYVSGSIDGAFPVYTFDPDSPAAYSSGGIAFELAMGGIDPAAGDTFLFSVIGARYKWRKDGGAYSAAAAIPSGATTFDAGLSFQFIPGVEPSFVADDAWTFRAIQKWAASNVQAPTRARWFPGTTAPNLYMEWASVQTFDAIGIALHTIPAGATITLTGGDSVGSTDWTETITWRADVIGAVLSQVRTGIWAQLNLASASGASIGWLWLGAALTTGLSADATPKLAYSIVRGNAGGLYQGAASLGKTVSVNVSWQEGALAESDVTGLTAMLDDAKSHNDAPLIFIPNATRPDAMFAKIVEDEIPLPDVFDLNPNAGFGRRQSASLTLQGVYT